MLPKVCTIMLPICLSTSTIFSIVVNSISGDVMRFSTARTTPSEVQIPRAVDPNLIASIAYSTWNSLQKCIIYIGKWCNLHNVIFTDYILRMFSKKMFIQICNWRNWRYVIQYYIFNTHSAKTFTFDQI